MIRRLPHFDYDQHHCHEQRNKCSDQPTRKFNRNCGASQDDKNSGPYQFERPNHPHHIAEQEKVSKHKSRDEAPPPHLHRQNARRHRATDKNEYINYTKPKTRGKTSLFHILGLRHSVRLALCRSSSRPKRPNL